MNDHAKKERIVDDILHTAGDNIKEAEYIANQLQLGKTTEEITTRGARAEPGLHRPVPPHRGPLLRRLRP